MAKKNRVVSGTVPLWPDVGQALSKNGTYAAAKRGEIPGLMRFGRVYRVSVSALQRLMAEGHKPADKR